ncbi:MAG: mechanosensitive ion channel family protein [Endomicrobium sp.]|jgi:small-conductance mechanosensitive channel|nr:mechanosensitive ion channel family protein [Endomicrobium sp.]
MLLQVWNQILTKGLLWVESATLFAFIFTIGFLFKRYVARLIQNLLAKVGLVLNDKIVEMTSTYVSLWFFLIALYVSILKSPLNTKSIIIDKVFYVVFAFSIVTLIASIVPKFLQNTIQERITSNILKFFITLIGLVLILNQVGVKLTPILTALGIGSVAVALALQDTLANLFAGINILASKQIAKDDYIKLDSGQEGMVVEVNWRTTLIKEIYNTTIVIPNSKISSAIVSSYHFKKSEVTVSIACSIAYGSNLDRVEEVAKYAAKEIMDKYDSASKIYEPVVQFTDFADSSINFILYFRVKTAYAKAFIKSEVLKNLYRKFNDEGIEIPFPQRVVTINKQ